MNQLWKVVSNVARRAVRMYGGPVGLEDITQEALLRALEAGDDALNVAWAIRGAIREQIFVLASDKSEGLDEYEEYLEDDGLCNVYFSEDEQPAPEWLKMFDEPSDPLENRLREFYEEPDEALEACRTHGGHSYLEEQHYREMEESTQSLLADDLLEPLCAAPEWRIDRSAVDKIVGRFNANEVCGKELYYVSYLANSWAQEAEYRGLTPPEIAILANRMGRAVALADPHRAGMVYGTVRIAIGDYLGEKGHLDDDDVWYHLYRVPPEYEVESPTPEGGVQDVLEWISAVPARTTPYDVTYEEEWVDGELVQSYKGWQFWDTAEARRAHLRAALIGLESYSNCALAGRRAFWALPNRSALIRANYDALGRAGLSRHKAWGYKVVPSRAIPVHSLYKNGVTTLIDDKVVRRPFESGVMLAVPRDKKESFIQALGKLECFGDFKVVNAA